jgi:hypothetical protein
VLTVEADAGSVERRLANGDLSCPLCDGRLGPWGWARRRALRGPAGLAVPLTPRRTRCSACLVTHVCWCRAQRRARPVMLPSPSTTRYEAPPSGGGVPHPAPRIRASANPCAWTDTTTTGRSCGTPSLRHCGTAPSSGLRRLKRMRCAGGDWSISASARHLGHDRKTIRAYRDGFVSRGAAYVDAGS